jgi:hypothetical protein
VPEVAPSRLLLQLHRLTGRVNADRLEHRLGSQKRDTRRACLARHLPVMCGGLTTSLRKHVRVGRLKQRSEDVRLDIARLRFAGGRPQLFCFARTSIGP